MNSVQHNLLSDTKGLEARILALRDDIEGFAIRARDHIIHLTPITDQMSDQLGTLSMNLHGLRQSDIPTADQLVDTLRSSNPRVP